MQRKNSGHVSSRTAALETKNLSSTKKGPGRVHRDGVQKMKNRRK